jgi:hypothetical protein
VLVGGFASAAQPSPVNADGDVVRAWLLRNGAAVNQLSAAGALIGGDATNGLDVDVTRVPSFMAPFQALHAEQTIAATTTFTNTVINGSTGETLMISNEGSSDATPDIIVKVGIGAQVDDDTGTPRRRIYAGTYGTISIPSGADVQIGVRAVNGSPAVRIQRGSGSL